MVPIFIAGPCMAESWQVLDETCAALVSSLGGKDVDFYFKASFDKANRTNGSGSRGPGLDQTMIWFQDLKDRYGVKILTDVHESWQVAPVAEVCDALQIPAFLCRQTDLIYAAVKSGALVNVKKGQFLAPQAMGGVVNKASEAAKLEGKPLRLLLTERGSSFGYGDLVVDFRGLYEMSKFGVPCLFDITHSTQKPATEAGVSGGSRCYAPLLTRAAGATGYVNGFFLETHPNPSKALSDAQSQVDFQQAEELITIALEAMSFGNAWKQSDLNFENVNV